MASTTSAAAIAREPDQQPPLPVAAATDIEAAGQLQRTPSRASIPIPPTPPTDGADQAEGPPEEEEFAWGPSHPCFPHMNPHVPLNSPLYESTRVIRIKRDWMQVGDLAPTFANLYPEVLDPLVSEEEFRKVVRHINAEIVAAFTPWSVRAWADALLGAATLWLYDDLGLPAIKQRLQGLEKWIDAWNKDVGEKDGVKIIPLRRTAYMTLDFQIPDPHISVEPAPGQARPSTAMTSQQPDNAAPYPISAVASPHGGQTHLPAGVSAH